jgi:hypothetical protein
VGENVVTVTGRDVQGNFTTCEAVVTVVDGGGVCEDGGEGEGEGEGDNTAVLVDLAVMLLSDFGGADADADGRLAYTEARGAAAGMTPDLFRALDADGNGYLSEAELRAYAPDTPRGGVGCFERAVGRLRDLLGDLLVVMAGLGVLWTSRRWVSG